MKLSGTSTLLSEIVGGGEGSVRHAMREIAYDMIILDRDNRINYVDNRW